MPPCSFAKLGAVQSARPACKTARFDGQLTMEVHHPFEQACTRNWYVHCSPRCVERGLRHSTVKDYNTCTLLKAVIVSRDAHALFSMTSHKSTLRVFAHHVPEHE